MWYLCSGEIHSDVRAESKQCVRPLVPSATQSWTLSLSVSLHLLLVSLDSAAELHNLHTYQHKHHTCVHHTCVHHTCVHHTCAHHSFVHHTCVHHTCVHHTCVHRSCVHCICVHCICEVQCTSYCLSTHLLICTVHVLI